MITRRNALWLVPTLLIVTFPLWKPPVANFLSPRGNYDLETIRRSSTQRFTMKGVTIMQSSKGKKSTNIRAERAQGGKPANQYTLYQVDADIIGARGNTTNVIADTGNYDIKRERLKLIGNVIVKNIEDNTTLTSELLYYYEKEKKVYCPGPTTITGDGMVVKGSSFGHDMIKGTYKMRGRVYCTIQGYTP